MRSCLVAIRPSSIKVTPAKLDAVLDELEWGGIDTDIRERCAIEDVFLEALESVKLYGYLTIKCRRGVERLFCEIMAQNPTATSMQWHFTTCDEIGQLPYSLTINRADMEDNDKQYAVKLFLGTHESKQYYHDSEDDGAHWLHVLCANL